MGKQSMTASKIFVCGDSYCSIDKNHPGKHFSEILQLTNLAYPGVSTFDICLQIKDAIAMQANFVIIGKTMPGRIEVARQGKIDKDNITDFSISEFRFAYKSRPMHAFQDSELSTATKEAIRQYMTYIYDEKIKTAIDSWCLEFWVNKLNSKKIKHMILPKDFCIYKRPEIIDPCFHTNYETQEFAAREINQIINQTLHLP
jgi:hypothetical protein